MNTILSAVGCVGAGLIVYTSLYWVAIEIDMYLDRRKKK